jgi:NADPH-dependent 2,4-dienoyl-CoA reductase/sulfur reductase-like enzyme
VRLFLEDGEIVDSDTVVVGIGTTPDTDWLTGSGLDLTDGILAAATCHAVRTDGWVLDDVVVAGDIARWPNYMFDTVARRVEHWINAIEMGQAAADNLLAGPTAATPFTPIPRFWTQQHDIKIQSLGMPALGHELRIIEGHPGNGGFIAAYTQPAGSPNHDAHRLMGIVTVNACRRLPDYLPLIGRDVTMNGWQAQPI